MEAPSAWTETSYEGFVDAVPPCFVRDEAWAVWRLRDTIGVFSWDTVSPQDVARFNELFVSSTARATRAVGAISDLRAMPPHSLSTDLLKSVHGEARKLQLRLTPAVERMAFLAPAGWLEAFLIGINSATGGAARESRAFPSLSMALEWLDAPQDAAAMVERLIAAVLDDVERSDAVERLVALDLRVSLQDVAARLGCSARTLQRALTDRGKSFTRLRTHARVRAAKRLLHETTLKVEAIAAEAGYGSARQFLSEFRTTTGVTPSAFRKSRAAEAEPPSTR